MYHGARKAIVIAIIIYMYVRVLSSVMWRIRDHLNKQGKRYDLFTEMQGGGGEGVFADLPNAWVRTRCEGGEGMSNNRNPYNNVLPGNTSLTDNDSENENENACKDKDHAFKSSDARNELMGELTDASGKPMVRFENVGNALNAHLSERQFYSLPDGGAYPDYSILGRYLSN